MEFKRGDKKYILRAYEEWSRILKKEYAKDQWQCWLVTILKRIVEVGVIEKVAQSYELAMDAWNADNAFTEKWQLNEVLHK